MSESICVLLAEDHTIVRQGLRALLAAHDDIEVVGEAASGDEAVEMASELNPAVVIMDIGMPGRSGIDATRAICSEGADAPAVIMLSMHSGEEYVRPAARAGARGYLVKGAGLSDLVTAIRTVAEGGSFYSSTVVAALIEGTSEAPELTEREAEVLERVAAGQSSAMIATALEVSVKTVERHRSRLMEKLCVANVAGLVRESIRLGLVDLHG